MEMSSPSLMFRRCSVKQYFNLRQVLLTYCCTQCLQEIEYTCITLTELKLMGFKILKLRSRDELELVAVVKY